MIDTNVFVSGIINPSGPPAELIQEKTKIQVSADPDDDKFLATAIDGQAQYVMTGDKSGLLQLGEYQSDRIVSSRLFLQLLRTGRKV